MLPESALAGKRIVVTRPANQSAELVELLRQHGAIIEHLPCIRIEAIPGIENAVSKSLESKNFDWIFFTSANAASELAMLLDPQLFDILDKKRVAAIGRKTAHAARKAGFKVDFEAAPGTAEAFIAQILAAGIKPMHVFYPTSKLADHRLERRLHAAGIAVTRLDIYRTVSAVDAKALQRLFVHVPDAMVFYSPSAVRSFFEALPEAFRNDLLDIIFAAIGTTTARALQKNGVHRPLIANQPTTNALVDALVYSYKTGEKGKPVVG